MTNRKVIYKPISPVIEQVVLKHGGSQEDVLEILKDLDHQGQLNPDSITDIARLLGLPPHKSLWNSHVLFNALSPAEEECDPGL